MQGLRDVVRNCDLSRAGAKHLASPFAREIRMILFDIVAALLVIALLAAQLDEDTRDDRIRLAD